MSPLREHFSSQSLNSWLDTPAGQAVVAQHGSRQAAAVAVAQAEQADRAWRRAQAEARAERFPDRYASVADAMLDIPDPLGGGGAQITGTTDQIVAAGRRVNPAAGWRNLGGEVPDGAAEVLTAGPESDAWRVADTRPPWSGRQ